MAARTKLAQLIARMEGFGKPGTIPTVRHNPGDLRHSPHSQHPSGKDDIGTIDTDEHGWEDLERQLEIYAGSGMNIRQMVWEYAPPSDANNTARYLKFVCDGLHCLPDEPVERALGIPAEAA